MGAAQGVRLLTRSPSGILRKPAHYEQETIMTTTEAGAPAPSRRRKRATASDQARPTPRLSSIEERQYEAALTASDVYTALRDYEGAVARRDSISRKLCGGSLAVTVADLAHQEDALVTAKKVLAQLARRTPILVRHPAFAAAVAA